MFYIFSNTNISSLGMVPGNPGTQQGLRVHQGPLAIQNAPPPGARGAGRARAGMAEVVDKRRRPDTAARRWPRRVAAGSERASGRWP
jgi:hypothetical protein